MKNLIVVFVLVLCCSLGTTTNYDLTLETITSNNYKGKLILQNYTAEDGVIKLSSNDLITYNECATTGGTCNVVENKIKLDPITLTQPITLSYSGNYDNDFVKLISNTEWIYVFVKSIKYIMPSEENLTANNNINVVATNLKFLTLENNNDPKETLTITSDKQFVIGSSFFSKLKDRVYGDKNKNILNDQIPNKDILEFLHILNQNVNKNLEQFLVPESVSRRVNIREAVTQSYRLYHMNSSLSTHSQLQSANMEMAYGLMLHLFGLTASSEETWMNEGLAFFCAQRYVDQKKVYPTEFKYKILDQFFNQIQSHAFETDGYVFAKKMSSFPSDDNSIRLKAASVIKTLWELCGDQKFESALKTYLQSQNRNLETFAEKFKECFGNEDSINLSKKYFKSWQNNEGYPVVHVNQTDADYTIKQERFYWYQQNASANVWNLLIKAKSMNNNETQSTWLQNNSITIKKNGGPFIIDNSEGYFRVNYEPKIWSMIISKLNNNSSCIQMPKRVRLINDVFSLARSTHKFQNDAPDYEVALNLTEYLRNEKDYHPLKAAFNELEFLDFALFNDKLHDKFRSYMKNLFTKLYQENALNKSVTEYMDVLKTKEIALWACKLNVADCNKHADELYGKLQDIHPLDLHEPVYCSRLERNSSEWDVKFKIMKEENYIHKKLIFIKGLGCSKNETKLRELMNYITDHEKDLFLDCFSAIVAGGPNNLHFALTILNQIISDGKVSTQVAEKALRFIYSRTNERSCELMSTISNRLSEEIKKETTSIKESIQKWKKDKTKSIDNFLNSGSAEVKPLALILLLSTVLPLANYIFH